MAPTFSWLQTLQYIEHGRICPVARLDIGNLVMPTGRLCADEPADFGRVKPFTTTVDPGEYPIRAFRTRGYYDAGEDDYWERLGALQLCIRDEPAYSWEAAVPEGSDPDLAENEYYTYAVDGGTGGFFDASLTAVTAEWDYDRIREARDSSEWIQEAYSLPVIDPATGANVVIVGLDGDGRYGTWIGRSERGDVACFLTDFGVPWD